VFYEDYGILPYVIALLQRERRVSSGGLKVQFRLDDEVLEAIQDELVYVRRLAVDEEGRVLVWTGRGGFDTMKLQEAQALLLALR
jgi:hypothetical protein